MSVVLLEIWSCVALAEFLKFLARDAVKVYEVNSGTDSYILSPLAIAVGIAFNLAVCPLVAWCM